jgi:ribosomal protein L12E/L44/L45/RPP1/RPP2
MNSRMLVAVAATGAKKRKDKHKIERRMEKGQMGDEEDEEDEEDEVVDRELSSTVDGN